MMTYGDWGYLALAFIIFSVSLAIVRRQFAHLAERSDVKKALKGTKFGNVFGGRSARGEGNERGRRSESVDSQGPKDERLIKDSDDNEASSSRKKITYTNQNKSHLTKGLEYIQGSVSKVIGGGKNKMGGKDNEDYDPCEYEVLDDCNNQ